MAVWLPMFARPYRPWPAGHIGRAVLGLMRDPATWRDVAWLTVACTVGLVVCGVVILLFGGFLWFAVYPLLWLWLTPAVLRGYAHLSRLLLGPTGSSILAARMQELTASRAETVDTQAAELRRIERDLHDGAQARLVVPVHPGEWLWASESWRGRLPAILTGGRPS